MNKTTKTSLVVEIRAQAQQFSQTLDSLKQGLSGLNAPDGLDKAMSKLSKSIDIILRKTKDDIIPREQFKEVEKELRKVGASFDDLFDIIKQISNADGKKLFSLLPEETQNQLNQTKTALEAYAKSVEKIIKTEQQLKRATEDTVQARERAKSLADQRDSAEDEVKLAKEKVKAYEAETAALKEQEAANKALAKAKKELEDAEKEGKSEKVVNNRKAKVVAAKDRVEAADKAVNDIDPKKLEDRKAALEAVTAAEQKYATIKKQSKEAEEEVIKRETEEIAIKEKLKALAAEAGKDGSNQQKTFQALKTALKAINPELKDFGDETKFTQQQLDKLTNIVNNLTDEELQRFKAKLLELGVPMDQLEQNAKDVAGALNNVAQQNAESDEAMSRTNDIETRIKSFLGLSGAAQVLRHSLRDAMSTITELDKQMTEMAVVTDLSVGDYWDQLPEYSKQASALGVSITSAYEAATLYYQQGLKANEVTAMSAETLKMARIAGLSAKDATDRMTAALRGFNMELNEMSAQKISDVYSELAAITASDVNEISKAMTKTASIASSAGMEFETTAAFLSQIIETTRESAETAGTAMKTVIARFQELKKAPDEIGEIDGEIVDANAIETALRSVGVSLRDSSGQFRELDDVFLELSSKWDSLDKNTQRYIATIAAGSRQQSRFIAMMSNYSRTQELVTAANNSAGASNEQFAKTAESLQSKMEKLNNAWHEFTMGIMNSDLVKVGVDILTKFLEIVNKATGALDGIGGSLTKIISVVAIFKLGQKLFEKFKNPLIKFFADIVKMSGEAATKATEEFVDKARETGERKKQEAENNKPVGVKEGNETAPEQEPEKTSLGRKIVNYAADKTGVSDFQKAARAREGIGELRNNYKQSRKTYQDDKKELDKLEKEKTIIEGNVKKAGAEKDSKKYIEAKEALTKAEANYQKQLEKTKKSQKDLQANQDAYIKKSEASYEAVTSGLGKMGEAAIAAGVGIQMLGGALSEAGFEEAGEVITGLGTVLTFAGSAASTVSSMMPIVAKAAAAAGIKVSMAWAWVFLIATAIASIVAIVIGAAKAAEKYSPDKKLEDARASADAAADAADRLAESYNNLKQSCEDIGSLQEELDGLARGTDAWNSAVQNLNGEILQLIKEYPELAKFMKNNNGVLTIDFEDEGVQKVLQDAKDAALNAQIVATGAEVNVLQAQDQVAYKNLDSDAKINYRNAESEAGWAKAGAMAGEVLALGGLGAAIGTAIAPGIGTAIGTGIGLIVGLVTEAATGLGDIAAKAAGDAAEASNESTQTAVEDIAKALASGDLIDTGSGYALANGVEEQEFKDKYRTFAAKGIEALDTYYTELGDSTDELIEFGETLNKTSEASKAYYESIAAQIYNNLDKTGWSKEDETIADNILDGASYEARKKTIEQELAEENYTPDKNGNLDPEKQARMDAAIQETYGAGSRLVEDKENGGYKIVDAKNQDVMGNVTSDSIKNIIASAEAKKDTEEVGANMPGVTEAIIGGFSKKLGPGVEDAVIAAFDDESGQSLTKEQLTQLEGMDNKSLEEIYQNSEVLQKAFGSLTNFLGTYNTAIDKATYAFDQSDTFFEDTASGIQGSVAKLTSGASFGLSGKDKLGSLYTKGTEEEIATFEEAFNTVMSGDNAEEIAAEMNAIDWSNQEAILGLYYTLTEEMGVGEEEARNLTNAMIDANDATSGLTTTVEAFGDFYQATQKINQALKKQNDLQWEYNRMLRNGADTADLAINMEAQRQAILEEGSAAINAYEAARENQMKIYAQGVDKIAGEDLTRYVDFNPETGQYDTTELREVMKTWSDDKKKEAEEWVKQLEEQNSLSQEQIDAARAAYDKLDELKEIAKQGYEDLYDQIGEVITATAQKQIDLQESLLDATKNANSKIVDKLQEQINKDRQERQNAEAEENIADMYNQMAYLGMDTSGSNALSMVDLEEQIAQAEQDYEDNRIDQSIQQLQDANAKAEEQRERQISIAEQQLELYKKSDAYWHEIDTQMSNYLDEYEQYEEAYVRWQDAQEMTEAEFNEKYSQSEGETWEALQNIANKPTFSAKDTDLGRAMVAAGFTEGMSSFAERDFWNNIEKNTARAAHYADGTLESDSTMDVLLNEIEENTDVSDLLSYFMREKYYSANVQADSDTVKNAYGVSFKSEKNSHAVNSDGSIKLDEEGNPMTDYSGSRSSSYVSDMEEISGYAGKAVGSEVKGKRETAEGHTKIGSTSILGGSTQNALDTMHSYGTEESYYSNLEKNNYKGFQSLRSDYAQGKTDSQYAWHTLVNSAYDDFEESWKNEASEQVISLAANYSRDGYEGAWENEPFLSNLVKEFNEFFPNGLTVDGIKYNGLTYVSGLLTGGLQYQLDSNIGWATIDGDGDDYLTDYNGNQVSTPYGWDSFGNITRTYVNGSPREQNRYISGGYTIDGENYEVTWDSSALVPYDSQPDYDLEPKDGWVALINDRGTFRPAIYRDNSHSYASAMEGWYYGNGKALAEALKNKYLYGGSVFREGQGLGPAYKTGGLADFTGPAWLDGTPSKPEYILNAAQTERFFSLVDILEGYDDKKSSGKSGDNYFDIAINVEKLENDYDIEKVADKIRRMIYDDATYRNVNAINHIR